MINFLTAIVMAALIGDRCSGRRQSWFSRFIIGSCFVVAILVLLAGFWQIFQWAQLGFHFLREHVQIK